MLGNQEWKNRKGALLNPPVSIIERWRASYGNLLVNSVFQERVKSYLGWLYVLSGERITSTHEAHRPSPTRRGTSDAPLAATLLLGSPGGVIPRPKAPQFVWNSFGKLDVF